MEDSYGSRRLSHRGKIISFHFKRESTAAGGEKGELAFSSFSFEPEHNTFRTAAEGAAVISRRISDHVDVVKCKCVVDVQRRDRTPCVLITKKGEKGKHYHYSLLALSGSNRLETRVEFKLPYQMRDNVSILQGPTVLWSHENTVFYTSPQAGGVRKIPAQICHHVFGELPLHRGQVFVLGLQHPPEQSSNSRSTRSAFGCFIGNEQVFDGSLILPHPYICITQCILVLTAHRVDGVLNCALIAATSSQQLVYFEDGIVKDVCQLPFERAEDIQLVDTGRNGSLFVVSFHQGNVCAVWKETFQIACHWSGVSSVHVEDFLGCGTDQMLLVFKDQGRAGQPLGKFLITDLCGVSYSCGQDSETSETAPPAQENYLLTIQALESRLQNGSTVLQELQRELRVKDRVLQQSVQVLGDVVSERETVLTQHEQEGLIALWDCDDESNDESLDDKVQDAPIASSEPQIDKLWHRVTEERLVVGVLLSTDSAAPVASVSLSLLTETGQSSTPAVIQTRSQASWLTAPCPSTPSSSSSSASVFSEPAAKRSKQRFASNDLNTCRLAVTAVTRLAPLLNSGCVKCRVMLHYAQKADAFSLVSNPAPVVLHCGRVDVDIHDVFQTRLLKTPQHETDGLTEDLLSLLAVLDHWVIHIDSPDYSLGDISGWIEKRMDCKKIDVIPQYLLLASSGPSAVMLLHWDHMTPFQGELSIHSSQLQMLQLLGSLLAFLPASCLIRPVKRTRGRSTSQAFASALDKEVSSLRGPVSSLLFEEDEEEGNEGSTGHEDAPEPGSAEGLQRCREAWQRDVERSRRRLSPLVEVGRYRKLIQSISESQMNCDLAALLDAQRTSLT